MPKTGDTMNASQKRKIAKAVSKYHKSACRGMSEYVRKKPNVAKGGGTIKRIKAGAVKRKVSREKGGKKLLFKRMGGNGDLLTMEDKKKLIKDIDTKWKEMLKENSSYYSTTKEERKKIRRRFFGIVGGDVELHRKYKKLRIQRKRERNRRGTLP